MITTLDARPALAPSVTYDNFKAIEVRSIYCIGRNYSEHAAELNNPIPEEPVVFLKSVATLRRLADGPLAFPDETFHHEAELVLLIDKLIPMGSAPTDADVAAVALGLDLTRREVQSRLKAKGLPWTTAKSFAGSALVGDFLPRSRFERLDSLGFRLLVNGELRQQGDTRNLLFPIPTILRYLATLSPLLPGDLIFTGTPAGVGPIKRGDKFTLEFTDGQGTFEGRL